MKNKKPLNEATIKMLANSERIEREIQAVCDMIRKEREAKGLPAPVMAGRNRLCVEANEDLWNC